ncbi:MAG: diguanylate cyclase domain-containing protein [Janthinobacterium lividum]
MVASLPNGEQDRLAALKEYRLLDTDPEEAYDDIVRLAAFICGTPIAAVTLVDAHRQWFKSILGLNVKETPREIAFCAHTILQPDLLEVSDAQADPRFADNPLVLGEPNIRFYAGVPLINPNGFALGTLCVVDVVPRTLTVEQKNMLTALARQVISRIELQQSIALQEQAKRGLERAEKRQARAEREQQRAELRQKESEQRLAASERRYKSLFDHNPHTVFSIDLEARFLSINAACEALSGYVPAEIVGVTFQVLVLPEEFERVYKQFVLVSQGRSVAFETMIVHKLGHIVPIAVTGIPIMIDGTVSGVYAIAEDITERRQAAIALHESEQHLRIALEGNGLESFLLDVATGEFLVLSDTCRAHFALPPGAEVSRTNFLALLHPDDRDRVQDIFLRAIESGNGYEAEYRILWPDRSLHWLSARGRLVGNGADAPTRMVGVTQDITERKQQEAQQEQALQEAREQADHDPLTNLLNHRAFQKKLEDETARAQREGTSLAVVMLDLDGFKFFNDVYGHLVGDDMLRQLAKRLQAISRSYDTVARFGGDEFALLLPGSGQTTPAEIEARLRTEMGTLRFRPEGEAMVIPITVSVGVAFVSALSLDCHEALRQADERLLRSKTGGEAETEADAVRASAQGHIAGFPMLDALVTAVDNKDRYTRKHSEDVMAYSLMIAQELKLDEVMQHTIAVAALLHDVGKVGVPDAVLRKPGKLTAAEFEAVKQHPEMGAILVNAVPGLEGTLDAVRHHHERWDGGGYPSGLKGSQTPLIARLMAVADAFSAMTTDRPYRQGMERETALSILGEGAGTQWDPECVEAFLKALPLQVSFLLAVQRHRGESTIEGP